MRKFILSSVAALVALGGLSAPVLADSLASSSGSGFDESFVLQQLRGEGINATAASQVRDQIQATVVIDGRTTIAYFDADTLQPIGADGNRVLSSVYTGAAQQATSTGSLVVAKDASSTD